MRAVAEAFPRVEVPEIRVENVPVVKLGFGVIAIVLVPEKRMLAPLVKYDTGVLKKLFQLVEDAVREIEYPA